MVTCTPVIVLRGGRVLDPSRGLDETADVVIEAGRIKDVGRDAGAAYRRASDVRIVDARALGLSRLHRSARAPS